MFSTTREEIEQDFDALHTVVSASGFRRRISTADSREPTASTTPKNS
jgi:hypothetical protein